MRSVRAVQAAFLAFVVASASSPAPGQGAQASYGGGYDQRQKVKPYAEFLADLADRPGRVIYTPYAVSATMGVVRGFVHVSDGSAVLARTDLVVDAPMPIVVRRAYHSGRGRSADFGTGGWHLTLAERIDVGARGDLLYIYGNGSTLNLDTRGRIRSPLERELTDVISADSVAAGIEVRTRTGLTKRFARNGAGYRLASVSDTYGNSVQLRYDTRGIDRILASSGAWAQIARDDAGRIGQISDSNGRSVLYRYDEAGRLDSVTDPGKLEWTYAYDASHRLERTTTPNGTEDLAFGYDKAARVAWSRINGIRSSYEFDGNKTRVIGGNGLATTYTAADSGLTVAIENSVGTRTSLTLDTAGLPKVLDRNGVRLAELVRSTTPQATVEISLGAVAAAAPARLRFDSTGRAMSLSGSKPERNYQVIQYGPALIPEHVVYGDGQEQAAQFDDRGELVRFRQRGGEVLSFEREGAGLRVSNRAGREVELQFSSLGRLASARTPDGWSFDFAYGAVGLRELVATSFGALVRYQYDAAGSLFNVQVSDSKGPKPAYTFVSNGDQRVASVSGTDGSVTTFAYGNAGELRDVTTPGQPSLRFEYDDLRRLRRVLREGKEPIEYHYASGEPDVVGQLTVRAVPAYNQQREISDFASRFDIVLTRVRPAALGFFSYDDVADELVLAADPAKWHPGAFLERSIAALRFENVLSENPRAVPHFVMPSNRFFVPAEYWSVNCCICLCDDPDLDCYVP